MNKHIFVIGGGHSLSGFDFSLLDGLETIGCNGSAKTANTKYVCSMDRLWINCNKDVLQEYGDRAHMAIEDKYGLPARVNRYTKEYNKPFTHDKKYLSGKHSGHAAFNLAYHMGGTHIHLLGIDLVSKGHWHGGYGKELQNVGQMKAWARITDQATKYIKGVKVIDWSIDGALSAYEKRNINELSEYLRLQIRR